MLRYLAVLFCLLLFRSVTAGTAVTNAPPDDEITFPDGSTAVVSIRKSSDSELAHRVTFRRGDSPREESLGPLEVESFRFGKSGRQYRSVLVDITDVQNGGVAVPRQRFGEVLASGDLELIKVHLHIGEYEVQAAGSQPYVYLLREGEIELVLKLTSIMVYGQLHANPARFRNLLKFLARDCPRATELARKAEFRDTDILRTLSAYGDCESLENLEIDRNNFGGALQLDHYARVYHLDIRDADFMNQFSVGLGYQVVTRLNNRFRRLAILASVDLIYHSYRFQDASDVSQSMIRGNFSLGYSPLVTEEFTVQLTGGLSNYNAVSSSFKSFFSDNYFQFNGGIQVLRKNFLFGLHYEHLPNQISKRPASMLLTTFGYRMVF